MKHQLDLTTTPASTNLYERTVGRKNYEMGNHLGNVLVTFSDRKIPHDDYTFSDIGSGTSDWNQVSDGSTNFYYAGTSQGNYYRTAGADGYIESYTADVLSANDYFAFGALQPGRNFNSNSYSRGFNGKEKTDEITGVTGRDYDYGFRLYDGWTGRLKSRDPLAKDYPQLSTYQYAGNSPIVAIDLDGLEAIWIHTIIRADGTQITQSISVEGEAQKEAFFAMTGVYLPADDVAYTVYNESTGETHLDWERTNATKPIEISDKRDLSIFERGDAFVNSIKGNSYGDGEGHVPDYHFKIFIEITC